MDRLKLLFLLTIFFTGSCATVDEKKLPVYPANTILLLPAKSLHKELKISEPAIDAALKKQLKKSDFKIFTLTADEYELADKKALEVSGSIYSPDVGDYVPLNTKLYVSSLKKYLGNKHRFDTLVMAKLLLREAEVDEKTINFDEVSRRIEYEEGASKGILPRRPRGLSIQLNAFAQGNNATQAVFGGVSLPFIIRVQDNKPEFVIKQHFFTDKELKEGVRIAVEQLTDQLEYQK